MTASGRVEKTTDPIGNEVSYVYDDTNKKVTRTSKEKNTSTAGTTSFKTVTTYNAAGWATSVKDEGSASGNRTTSYEYDYRGKTKKVTEPDLSETTFIYDALGRMTSETTDVDASTTAVTAYVYTDGGLLDTVTDANSNATTWVHDSFGRELSMTTAVSAGVNAVFSWEYATNGRLDSWTDPAGVVKSFHFDEAGRVTRVDINKASSGLGGPDRLVFTYDNRDRILSGKTQTGSGETYTDITSVSRRYDGYGQLKDETQYGGHVVAYTYDVSGALNKITYPTSSPITSAEYVMDDNSRVDLVKRTLSGGSALTVASFEYDGHREINRNYAQHGLKRTQSWTTFREPDQLKYLKDSTSALLTGFDNAWDTSGQITVRERMHDEGTYGQGEVYRYDEMGRLVKMWTNQRNPQMYSSSNPTANYDDKVEWDLGKVYEREDVTTTPEGGTAASAVYTSNAGYQYTNIGTAMTWDNNGQLTDWGTTDYAWTSLGQMSQAAVSGETARDYTYDAFGRRVKTLVGSAETQMLYHGWHMIGAYDNNNSHWLWQEVPMNRGEGMIEHVALDTNDMDDDENVTEYLGYAVHEDHQSTVWALSNSSGAITERYVQDDPFGASHTLDASGNNIGNFSSEVYHHKRLHGGVVEPVSGLYDFRNRWLSFESGTWLSRDPLGDVDSENLYVFNLSNPLTHSDPYGLCAESERGGGTVEIDLPLMGAIGGNTIASIKASQILQDLMADPKIQADCYGECYVRPYEIGRCSPAPLVFDYIVIGGRETEYEGWGLLTGMLSFWYIADCNCNDYPIEWPHCSSCHNADDNYSRKEKQYSLTIE